MATIAMAVGTLVGYLTQYVTVIGIPAVQSLIVTGVVYYIAMKLKARVAPDHFTHYVDNDDIDTKLEAN